MPTPAATRPSARAIAPLVVLLLLAFGALPAAAIHIHLDTGEGEIDIEDDDVVIATGSREARISPRGELSVDGRRVRVTAKDRDDLIRYNVTMHWLEDRAVDLGLQGAGLAVAALGEALAAVLSGDEEGVERRVEARAERIKDDARELCLEVRRLERVQDRLAASVAAFRPFAVMELEADDCDVDD